MPTAQELLAEVWKSFPTRPYPGDRLLGDCRCEECAWAVRNLRGRSWKQITLSDLGGDGDRMSDRAFVYYLPALLSLSLRDPDADFLASQLNARLVVSDGEPEESRQSPQWIVSRLSPGQRAVLFRYFEWLRAQGWQSNTLIDAAQKALSDGVVEPFSADAFEEELDRRFGRRAKRGDKPRR